MHPVSQVYKILVVKFYFDPKFSLCYRINYPVLGVPLINCLMFNCPMNGLGCSTMQNPF